MPRTKSNRQSAAPPKTASRKIEAPLQPDMPDDVRRRDREAVAPDTMPRPDEEARIRGLRPSEDGNVEQHPIHDSDVEDADAQDFEDMVDAAERGGFDPTDKYEVERAAELERKRRG